MDAVVKLQKRSLLSNASFTMNSALGVSQKEIDHLFDPDFFAFSASRNTEPACFPNIFHLNQFAISSLACARNYPHIHNVWPTETVGSRGWEIYGVTGQIKCPLTTNDSFIG